MEYAKKCTVTIVMPPREKKSLEEELFGNLEDEDDTSVVGDSLYAVYASTRVQDANTSVEKDRVAILEMVRHNPGFTSLNNHVNDLMRAWFGRAVRELLAKKEVHCNLEQAEERLVFAKYSSQVGTLFGRNGEYDTAINICRKALSLLDTDSELEPAQPTIAMLHQTIGRALHRQNDFEAAMTEHLPALSIRVTACGERSLERHTPTMILVFAFRTEKT
jgi:tetratricopeptide (TPR) repeat protein